MDFEVVATAEFEALLGEAASFRADNYGLRSVRKLLDAVDKTSELLSANPYIGGLVEKDVDKPSPDALRWIKVDSYIAIDRVHDEARVVALLKLFYANSNWRRRVQR